MLVILRSVTLRNIIVHQGQLTFQNYLRALATAQERVKIRETTSSLRSWARYLKNVRFSPSPISDFPSITFHSCCVLPNLSPHYPSLRMHQSNLSLHAKSWLQWAALILMATPLNAAPGAQSCPIYDPSLVQIFHFPPEKAAIENIHTRPNGHLLFTTLHSGDLFTLDPSVVSPQPQLVASLPGATGLCGIATVDAKANIYAIGGGEHISFGFTPGTVATWVVQYGETGTGVILDRIPVDAVLNGMVSLPWKPHIVLGVDSSGGRVMRINTQTRHVDVAIQDLSLAPGATFKLGVNGARIRDNFLYFTNSGQGTFARVPIDLEGNKVGDVEVIATLPKLPALPNNAYDDFLFDDAGNAYVALHSSSVARITPKGDQTVFLHEPGYSPGLIEPTSAALSLDRQTLYVCTAGTTVGATRYGGQIFQVKL